MPDADGGTIKVLGFAGSLRQASFNRALLREAVEMAPPSMTIETYDLAGIPEYNDDVREKGYPAPVQKFRAAIAAADALLMVTPEYNYSIPGVLKNAIDWASRPPDQPLAQKPIALMSASQSLLGGARAQYHLRQVFVFTDSLPVNKPEVFVMLARDKFDPDLKLKDETTKNLVRQLLANLVTWTRLLKAGREAVAVPK